MKTQNLLSKLWTFLMVNYLFCDVFSLYHSKFLNELLMGKLDGIEFTESFLLSFSMIMEIPMLMILVSYVTKPRINRVITISSAIFMLTVQIGSLTTGSNSLHYIFFSIVEMATLLLIIFTAWKWSERSMA